MVHDGSHAGDICNADDISDRVLLSITQDNNLTPTTCMLFLCRRFTPAADMIYIKQGLPLNIKVYVSLQSDICIAALSIWNKSSPPTICYMFVLSMSRNISTNWVWRKYKISTEPTHTIFVQTLHKECRKVALKSLTSFAPSSTS